MRPICDWVDAAGVRWKDRAHFFALSAAMMRRILVDYARRHLRAKRGGRQAKLSLDEVVLLSPDRPDKMLALDESLTRLEKLDARQGRIVELRYFGGLTVEEAAEILRVSPTTVRRESAVRHGQQGRRPRLPASVRRATGRDREHHATRARCMNPETLDFCAGGVDHRGRR